MFARLRRTRTKFPGWETAGIVLAVLFLCAIVLVVWIIRSPLPQTNGTLAVSGLEQAATIRRDERGIPHITAGNEPDLFFAQGFACAQDRLWQMDALRRQAQGRLSEVAGPAALETDRYMRTLGFRQAAESDLLQLRGPARTDLLAYAAGVNAAMATHPLPLEFRLLGYAPDPWAPVDSITIVKLMAQRLDDQWEKVELRSDLMARVGATAARALTNNEIPRLEEYVGNGTRASSQPAEFISLAWARYRAPVQRELDTGSNNWSVSGTHTTTGAPVLSNDTHLAHSLPSTWWLSQLHGPTLNAEGFQVPGIPGIILGHNERIAFGVTSASEAVQDLYVERFRSPLSDEYLASGRWVRAVHRIERIAIKGHPETILDILVTRHGPILERHGTRGLALAWTILRAGGEMQALTNLARAGNWQQFRAAARDVVGPALSFVYADVNGNIGYQDVGRVPNRQRGDGTLPAEGQDDRYAWHGFLPFDALPHVFNPPGGVVATANNQVVPSGLAVFADAPYRIHRIYDALRQPGLQTPQQIGGLQADVYDYPRARLAVITGQQLSRSPNPLLRRIAAQVRGWDGRADIDSPIPTFLSAEDEILSIELLQPKLGAGLLERYRNDYHPITPLLRVVDGDKTLSSIGITHAAVLAAIPKAALDAATAVGANPLRGLNGIQLWGEKNAAIYEHPLGRFWPINAMLNIRPLAQPGTTFAVYAGRPTYGPSQRLVVDLADWDNSPMLLTLGESGLYSDPHYADQAESFLKVHWVPTPFTDKAVERVTKDTLILKPKS